MIKIYINRQPINGPWGGGNRFTTAAYDFVTKSNEHVFSMNPDVFLCLGLGSEHGLSSFDDILYHKANVNKNSKIVLRVNENDVRKNTNDVDVKYINASKHVDAIVYVSSWLRDYYSQYDMKCKNEFTLINGVDDTVFCEQEKINNEKINIVSAHWSDNYLKGADYTEWLDKFVGTNDDFTFTFIGRTNTPNSQNLIHVPPLDGVDLGKKLGQYDVCVNATRFDPGPNSVIEPISCKLPTFVHVDGGGAPEFAGQDHVFKNFLQLEEILLSKSFKHNKTSFTSWDTTMEQLNFIIKSIL